MKTEYEVIDSYHAWTTCIACGSHAGMWLCNCQQRIAMRLALEALEECQYMNRGEWPDHPTTVLTDKALAALREAMK